MKGNRFQKAVFVVCLSFALSMLIAQNLTAQELCIEAGADQKKGEKDGFLYELWNENSQGTACMTLGDSAKFSGEWSGIQNYLARRGLGYDQTQEHQDIGEFQTTFDCDYNPSSASGNSYLSVYGWTVEPLVEYYIIEDWRNWIPSMANGVSLKGSFEINGSVYDVLENTRVNKPSIVGNTTFQQYFSIRRDERTRGTIDISEHFKFWEGLGMDMGKLHEVSFVVEGYQSQGSFEFTELDVISEIGPIVLGTQTPSLKGFDVYPNPSSGSVSISYDESILKSTVTIYDALGGIVFSQQNSSHSPIQVPDLESGIYLVTLNSEKYNLTDKLIIY